MASNNTIFSTDNSKDWNETINSLNDKLSKIFARISAARKDGANTALVGISIMNISSKIKYAKASRDYIDIEKVKSLLADADKEISEVELSHSLESIFKMIDILEEAIDVTNIEEGKALYKELQNAYNLLPEGIPADKKKIIFNKCKEIYKRIHAQTSTMK